MKIEMHSGWMAVIVTLIIALIGAAYKFGTDISSERVEHLEQLVAELKESSNLNYPDTIKALRDASNALALNKGEQEKLKNLEKENAALKNEIAIVQN